MNLVQFLEKKHEPIPLGILSKDVELIRDIQAKLMLAGLLDPPIDGKFGQVSQWALNAFCNRIGYRTQGIFTTIVADALLNREKGSLFPVSPGNDFAGKVISTMIERNYWFNRHPDCFNILYIEGCGMNGVAKINKPNEFNDARLLISIGGDNVPKLMGAWDGTTEPGQFWTMHPMDPDGAARIAFGQYKSWVVGTHHLGEPSAHEALVQADDVTVYRDLNRDFQRNGDKIYTGIFGINQHWGYDSPESDLRKSSAGCLVGRTKKGHKEFMALIKKDPRYRASAAYRYITTILPFSVL